ncbi:hypothetical protein G6F46_007641 [Rhizopus delemar]|uniref:Uncharacterized protein n=2 Tax=Rhizopus TaxID=4842 RepID=A0A9P6Z0G9_9FUNG|nr:hypothetical protein G6F55_006533 [Rhizopus delemar]KAG1541375.1 hypothetical protein G6F51_007936 [Rhizopus arrhizus]KAG1495497.1 hypothetical protein G6F54_007124 [Rhizopus delemar]KAG1512696.1 hypothetical protein G6F53_004988 [Rhizopus delemar]KAG1520191.1 hypothetical protein G6F52_007901 [Rhizopus delemar]
MSPPKCHPDDVKFKFKESVDLLVSHFFMTTFASDWRFKNYSDWHGNLIKEYSGSPHTIKGFVSQLLNKKEKKCDQEPVKTTTIYKDSIVGGHNYTLIHTHDQGQSSGKSDGNSDDQSYHTQKDDATSQATPNVRRPPLNSANNNTTSNSSPSNSYDDELDYEATPNTIDAHPDADDVCPSDTLPLISPPVSSSDESTATSTSQLSLSLQAPHGAPFIVDRVDISERFYRLQQYVFNLVKTNKLTVESDSHLILSLSSILLLQNNNRLNHAMIPFFGDKLYSKIRKYNLDE